MEIAEGVHRIACPFGQRLVYCYLIVGAERRVLVDTGVSDSPDKHILPYLRGLGLAASELDLVVITHSDFDHQGGNDAMRRAAPGAAFACHALDAPWVESPEALIAGRYSQFEREHGIGYGREVKAQIARDCASHVPMDWKLTGGESYRIGPGRHIRFLHTPGHTWGHLAIWDEATGTLIAGEAALWRCILGLHDEPAMPPTYCYVESYQGTLQRLLAMGIQVFAPAHWPVRRGREVEAFLADSLAFCQDMEAQLLGVLSRASEAMTLREIIAVVGPRIASWPPEASMDLAFPISGHLSWLLARGLVVRERKQGLSAYRAAH